MAVLKAVPLPGWLPTADMVNSDDPAIRASQVANLARTIEEMVAFLDQIQATGNALELGSTVVEETTYGKSASAGSSVLAARVDHTHGSPSLGTTVTSETVFGLTPSAGSSAVASKADHTHGSPGLSNAAGQDVGSAGASGSSLTPSRSDHVHRGVRSVAEAASTALYGDVTISGSGGIVASQVGQNIDLSGSSVAGAPHALLGTQHTDTVANTPTKGSLVAANSTPAWDELPVGADGTILEADSAQATGLKWSTKPTTYPGAHALLGAQHSDTSAASPSRGDLVAANSSNQWARLAKGSAHQVPVSDGTDVAYQHQHVVYGFDVLPSYRTGQILPASSWQSVTYPTLVDDIVTTNVRFMLEIYVGAGSGTGTLQWRLVTPALAVILSGSSAQGTGAATHSFCISTAASNLPVTCATGVFIQLNLNLSGRTVVVEPTPNWRCR